MQLVLQQGNVLDARADALIISVDGGSKKMPGNVAKPVQKALGGGLGIDRGGIRVSHSLGICRLRGSGGNQ